MKIRTRIPTTMSDATVEQYQQWVAVAEKPDQEQSFLDEKLIQYMTGLPQIAVSRMNRKQYRDVLSKLQKMMSETPNFTRDFEFGGVHYGFIPHFERDVLFKEWTDLDTYMSSWATMHKALGIMYRPITARKGDAYQIEEYDFKKDCEHFKKLPLDIAIGATLFFWTLASQLFAITPKYLEGVMKGNPKAEAAMSKSGGGIPSFMRSLEEISSNATMLLPSHWGTHYYGLLMSATTKEKLSEV